MDLNRRQLLQAGAVVGIAGLVPLRAAPRAWAAATARTPLPGNSLKQFLDPLPVLAAQGQGLAVVTGTDLTLSMREIRAYMLPTGTFGPGVRPTTWAYGYVVGDQAVTSPQETYLGPVIIAARGTPTSVRWVNDLPTVDTSNVPVWADGSDLTLHWANPLGDEAQPNDTGHYTGPIPTVPHLHGGEVPPVLDGGPDSWYTSTGIHGHAYHAGPGGGGNASVYRYPNTQEAAPIWFHDHVLGGTRLNVYAGLAGAYLVTDPDLSLPIGLTATGLQQGPSGPTENLVPLVIQDRSFDTNGQLLIPNTGLNPEHPYWVPEFVGDTVLVNGRVWPYLSVEPRRYRFLIINGSNARAYELYLHNPVTKLNGPPMYQIATDGGYLDRPVKIDPNAPKGQVLGRLTLLPGERADIIIDFAGFQGQNLVMRNIGRHPYPKGAPPDGTTVGRIMQFRVGSAAITDTSYNPADGGALRPPMVRLANPATATLAAGVSADKTRQLTLNEVIGAGGPLEVLVNNTMYDGVRPDGTTRSDFEERGDDEFFSEVVTEGETEVWEIVNLTADAHPIHTHLAQVQIVNRQGFNLSNYTAAYNAAFPGKAYVPGYGPPLNYSAGNPRALGGNPDVTRYLQGGPKPPASNEAGWKDTVVAFPGEVTRFAVRYAPTDLAVGSPDLTYPFDPDAGPDGHGYVWHCHIIDHEDNEMMRPLGVNRKDVARTVTDY